MSRLSKNQINALRYYVGEPDVYPGLPHDPKAYNTLNALFFPGIESEMARAKEGRFLNSEFFQCPKALLRFFYDMVEAMRIGGRNEPEKTVYRVDRESDAMNMIARRQTISFTSTSKTGFLKEYTDKDRLVLLEFHLPQNIPHADMEKLLPVYKKPGESEILLPPWLCITSFKRDLTNQEFSIRDKNGKPPVRAYIICAERTCHFAATAYPFRCLLNNSIYESLMNGIEPEKEDVERYLAWKHAMMMCFWGVWEGKRNRDGTYVRVSRPG